MPNWTYNRISFNNERDYNLVKDETLSLDDRNESFFDFEKIIPSPKKIEDCPQEFRVGEDSHIQPDESRPWFDWYKWNNHNWNTKWNSCDTYFDDSGLTIEFSTAWCAPNPIFEKLVSMFPSISFNIECEYEEGITLITHHESGSLSELCWEETYNEDEDEDEEDSSLGLRTNLG